MRKGSHVRTDRAQSRYPQGGWAPMTCSADALIAVDATDGVAGRFPFILAGTPCARRITRSVDDLAQLDQQMALLADGDRSAIEPLFRALWSLVHAYCQRALGAGADADDAAQQALA